MNPRERVMLALNHKEPDRIAIDLGGSICSSIHKKAYIESCNTYLDQIGKYLQVFTYWDDLNSQDGWLISPDIYRKIIKPKQRRLVEAIKKKTDAKIYYHGCGAVFD